MAHWMNVPELERTLQEMNGRGADLETLRAAVQAIAAELDRPVKAVGAGKMVTFEYPGLAFYNVSVRDDEYRVLLQHEAAQLDLVYGYTEDLAWRICGYPCSPAEMREARKRAEAEGLTDKRLPPRFFFGRSGNRSRSRMKALRA